jgi:hypothetical protein
VKRRRVIINREGRVLLSQSIQSILEMMTHINQSIIRERRDHHLNISIMMIKEKIEIRVKRRREIRKRVEKTMIRNTEMIKIKKMIVERAVSVISKKKMIVTTNLKDRRLMIMMIRRISQ